MKFDSYSILKENKMAQYKYHSCLDVNKDGFLELKIFNCMFHEISLPKFKKAKEKMSDAEYKDLESIGDANIFTYQSAGSDSYELKHKYGNFSIVLNSTMLICYIIKYKGYYFYFYIIALIFLSYTSISVVWY